MTNKLSLSLRLSALAGLAAFAAGLFVPTPAQAQIPSNGVFYGCMRVDRDGDEGKLVRLVAASEPCRRNEIRISWSQQGPKGDKGDKGNTGNTGAAGATGATGANGPAGATGATGSAGPVGPQGTVGPQGAIGPQGAAGPQGATGAAGAVGATGDTGATGPKGDKGDAGDNAQGVIAEGGSGGGNLTTVYSFPNAPNTPSTVLGGTLVVSKPVTGFRGYMVFGNAAVQFQATYNSTGLKVNQTAISATCALRQGVLDPMTQEVTLDPTVIDVRSLMVFFPPTIAGNGQTQTVTQRYSIGLAGDSANPGSATDTVVTQLYCGSNGVSEAANTAAPLAVPSGSIAAIGMNGVFGVE